jgi:pyrroline-5-carboxylate reductase
MPVKVILVGCGNMGYAMLSGWLKSGRLVAGEVLAIEPQAELLARAERLGSLVAPSPDGIGDDDAPSLVVFAVKPQAMAEVVPAYRSLARKGAAFLSIAAGTRIARLEELLGGSVPVVRCMPNTPAAIGKGAMALVGNAHVDRPALELVTDLLSASGEVVVLEDERLMDAVTAVSGSGPAYLFHFIEALAAAAEKTGLPKEVAARLALQTVYGAACLAHESGTDPAELRRQVTSPNGTTAAALEVLMGGGALADLVGRTVDAAFRRSVELGKGG